MAQLSGKIACFNNQKEYGSITQVGGPDIFCHFSSIQKEGYKSLAEGHVVRFDVEQGIKGPQAANVRLI